MKKPVTLTAYDRRAQRLAREAMAEMTDAELATAIHEADAAYSDAIQPDGTGGIDECLRLLDIEDEQEMRQKRRV